MLGLFIYWDQRTGEYKHTRATKAGQQQDRMRVIE